MTWDGRGKFGDRNTLVELTEMRPKTYIDYTPPSQTSRKTKIKQHLRKFWWAYVIGGLIINLVSILITIYVIIPKIVQKQVNNSSLFLSSMSFSNPSPDSLVVNQRVVIQTSSSFQPTLEAFNSSVSRVTNGVVAPAPIINLPIPQFKAENGFEIHVGPARVPIASMEEVEAYSIALLTQNNLVSRISGSTRLHLGPLPVYTVAFNQDISYLGLNGLQGFNVTNVRFNFNVRPGTPNMIGVVEIPNPSVLTISMGKVVLSLATVKAGIVGNATIAGMTLRPNTMNIFPMTGIIDAPKVGASLNTTGFANLQISGQSVMVNGTRIPYFERALSSTNLTLDLNVAQVLRDSAAAAAAAAVGG